MDGLTADPAILDSAAPRTMRSPTRPLLANTGATTAFTNSILTSSSSSVSSIKLFLSPFVLFLPPSLTGLQHWVHKSSAKASFNLKFSYSSRHVQRTFCPAAARGEWGSTYLRAIDSNPGTKYPPSRICIRGQPILQTPRPVGDTSSRSTFLAPPSV